MCCVLLVAALSVAGTAHACPACKQALASTEHAGMGDPIRGFMWSILFMMSMPFLLLSGFGAYLWYIVRRARLAAERSQALAVANAATEKELRPITSDSETHLAGYDEREPETIEVG